MQHHMIAWSELNQCLEQPLPEGTTRLIVGRQQGNASRVDSDAIKVTALDAELLHSLPLPVIIAALPEARLAAATVCLTVSSGTPLDALLAVRNMPADLEVTEIAKGDASWPALAPKEWTPVSVWRRRLISRILETIPTRNSVAKQALEAGFLLLQDDLDGSHRCSQAIEGEGPDHPGDYWHAIMHRREPDDSNSKYWFRHLGQHPVFARLIEHAAACAANSSSEEFRRWAADLVRKGAWDPFGFVDLCSLARRCGSESLLQSCGEMQYREMQQLLVWTWHTATATG